MKKIFTLIALCSLVQLGFSQSTSTPPCNGLVADFSYEVYPAAGGINFKSTSQLPTGATVQYEWSFGNGKSSSDENPFMMYDEGTYTVVLKLSDQDGCSVSTEKEVEFSYGQ
jgi:PKD repeat protein